ncbi:universal stress protein [Listeria booriae]|uniref:Universal stress protein n=1 Tax=Listeria booriae TaxID=1552123 RepID=A0A841W1P4_9LIST|nr:universal stress protein [Listeria booriae]MBC1226992.1 universal stress protein [Listeria booriae]MBC1233801.1 universal stress protein [Listeria booriae]MBC1246049.1 universal stress protein [Listeria booriae]MBC1316758.1 universal stress protein [Listeria booriae]MBC2365547.1 universal stress protein [Listeria booriae]
MTIYHRILVGVDGSNESEEALKRGIQIAIKDGATLGIGFVADVRRIAPLIDYEQTYAKKAKEYGKGLVEIYKNEAETLGVKDVETFVKFGTPKTTFVKKIIGKFDPDLVLVGSTGLTPTEEFLLGSVSNYVAAHAPCDVIVVKGKDWKERHNLD